MKQFTTEDGTVSKYIHEDGSETAIKHVNSCQQILNPITNKMESVLNNRNKFTVFISTTKGCFLECKFCHLTMKSCSFKMLTANEVFSNLKEAINETLERNPPLKDYYIKLSWMGMGDAFVESKKVKEVSIKLIDYLLDNNLVKGLDGVDLSTVYPNTKKMSWKKDFKELNELLQKYPQNPNNKIVNQSDLNLSNISNYKERSPFGLFYSIHSAVQLTRDKLIPKAMPIESAIKILLSECTSYNIVFHHVFLNGINDTTEELDKLVEFCEKYLHGKELRILRYNECNFSFFHESNTFENIISRIKKHVDILKVQISPGSEIKAACGQFIVDEFKKEKI